MRKFIILSSFLASFFYLHASASAATVKYKMVVANPSVSEPKTVAAKTYLPKGIKPQDITDKGKFEIRYDFEKSLYYVYQEVMLRPQELLTLELSMQNIWVIPDEEIIPLTEHTQRLVSSLKNNDSYSQAQILEKSIIERLDKIIKVQSLAGISIEQAISHYETNRALLKEVKKDISVLEDLVIEVSGPAAIGPSGLLGEADLSVEPIKAQYTELEIEKLGTVKFKIEVYNPYSENSSVSLKYYLPAELKPEYIVDKGDLEVGYDYQKNIHYIYKDDILLAPGEKKEFIVQVKDVWEISLKQIDVLSAHATKLVDILQHSEYIALAKPLADKIMFFFDNIKSAQNNTDVSVEIHIGNYREDLKEFDEARKNIARLERLVRQAGGSTTITVAGEKKTQLTKEKTEDELQRTAKGLELISKSIFRSKAPDIKTTWKIIWIILIFLALVSFLFFVLWWLQVKTGAAKKRQ